MSAVTVITPPAAALTVADARVFLGDGGTDEQIELLLTVAQAQIEPPLSVWGRSFGLQTLEMTFPTAQWRRGRLCLWYPPVAAVSSVKYLDLDGAEQTLDAGLWVSDGNVVVPAPLACWPDCIDRTVAARVRYSAGEAAYPEPVKLAMILMVQQMRTLARDDVLIKREIVDGVGSTEWDLSEQAATAVRQTADRLLSPYRVTAGI